MVDLLNRLYEKFCGKKLKRRNVVDYILDFGKEQDIFNYWIKSKM